MHNANPPISLIQHPTATISDYYHYYDAGDPAIDAFAGIIINIHTHTNASIQPVSHLINVSCPYLIIAASVEEAITTKPGEIIASTNIPSPKPTVYPAPHPTHTIQ